MGDVGVTPPWRRLWLPTQLASFQINFLPGANGAKARAAKTQLTSLQIDGNSIGADGRRLWRSLR